MASDSKKSNQTAGEGKQHCSRAHWLAVLGTMEMLDMPDGLRGSTKTFMDLARFYGSCIRHDLTEIPCTCIDCQRHPRRSEDKNPHEGKVML